jgi:hypothetical protein
LEKTYLAANATSEVDADNENYWAINLLRLCALSLETAPALTLKAT